MKRFNNKKLFIMFLILFISVGFAFLSANLNIRGLVGYKASSWDVHFENVEVINDIDNTEVPVINSAKNQIDFSVSFSEPGEKYSFVVDVVNAGTIDAMVGEITKEGITPENQKYLTYTVTYDDGVKVSEKDLIRRNCSVRILVKVQYNYDVNSVVDSETTHLFTLTLNYVRATEEANDLGNSFDMSKKDKTIIVDNAKENSINTLKIYGDTYQEHYTGQNLYNFEDIETNYTGSMGKYTTVSNDGWITMSCDNSDGSKTTDFDHDVAYSNYYTKNLNLDLESTYSIVLEVKSVSGSGALRLTSTLHSDGQFVDKNYNFSSLKNNHVYIYTAQPHESESCGLRTFSSFKTGENGSITFRLSVIKGDNVTEENFKYEPYVGGKASPSWNYPQKIDSVTNDIDISIHTKNLLNYKKMNSKVSSYGIDIDENDYIYDKSPDSDSREWSYGLANFYLALSPGTYTLSLNFIEKATYANDNNGFHIYTQDNKILCNRDVRNVNTSTCTITLEESANIGIFVKAYNGKYRIQLEKGDTATEWEPVKYYSLPLSDISLNALDDSKDYIYNIGNKWYIHQETKKLKIDSLKSDAITDHTERRWFKYLTDSLVSDTKTGNHALCSFATLIFKSGTWLLNNGFTINEGRMWLYFDDWAFSSNDEINSWLSTNDHYLYYKLVNPVNVEIKDESLISVLNKLLDDNLFSGDNIVKVSGSNMTPDISFLYKQN